MQWSSDASNTTTQAPRVALAGRFQANGKSLRTIPRFGNGLTERLVFLALHLALVVIVAVFSLI
jgi:hypothetical protein